MNVHVNPRSSKNSIAGLRAGAVAVKLTAPPVDNKANKLLSEFLAKALKVKKREVDIVSGDHSRKKVVRIKGKTAHQVKKVLEKYL